MPWTLIPAVVAQATSIASPDPLAGWFSVVLQGGAFGLLTYIVTIVVPRELRAAREERKERDKDTREEREKRDAAYNATLMTMHDKFDERNAKIIQALERQTVTLSAATEKSSDKIQSAVTTACKHGQAQSLPMTRPNP